jgi:hypothetical protein
MQKNAQVRYNYILGDFHEKIILWIMWQGSFHYMRKQVERAFSWVT